jgi:hypothetical protein
MHSVLHGGAVMDDPGIPLHGLRCQQEEQEIEMKTTATEFFQVMESMIICLLLAV